MGSLGGSWIRVEHEGGLIGKATTGFEEGLSETIEWYNNIESRWIK